MTSFVLIESYSDTTMKFIHEAAKKKGIQSHYYYYESLLFSQEKIKNLPITDETVVFCALPFTANNLTQSFQPIVRMIQDQFPNARFFNRVILKKNFLEFEDKLFQSYFFEKHGFPTTPLIDPSEEHVDFPLIARKRISSRSKNNFILENREVNDIFLSEHNVTEYVFQKFTPLQADFRVYVLGKEIIGVVKREVQIVHNNKVSVKVAEEGNISEEIAEECIRLNQVLGTDFLGVDIGVREDGSFFVIEYNTRAQIKAAVTKLKLNIAEQIVAFCV